MFAIVLGAAEIGVTLGLLGSGGSILTVPVLVYGLGHPDKSAIAESLAIVGGISAIGSIPFIWARNIDWRSVWFFGLPGMAGTYLGAALAAYVPGPVQLVLFALVMVLAAVLMFRGAKFGVVEAAEPDVGVVRLAGELDRASISRDGQSGDRSRRHPLWQIVLEGLLVGVLTGLVGVGGGFLIVPALVLLGGLSMRLAVGTSLIVIALKSLSGFFKYLHVLRDLDAPVAWNTVAVFIAIGIVGTVVGGMLNRRLSQPLLQRAFALFLLAMGSYVLYREIPHALQLPTT